MIQEAVYIYLFREKNILLSNLIIYVTKKDYINENEN